MVRAWPVSTLKFKIPSIMIVAHAFRRAGQQGSGVHEHKRIVVGVHDPALRRYALCDLVCVINRGKPFPPSQ